MPPASAIPRSDLEQGSIMNSAQQHGKGLSRTGSWSARLGACGLGLLLGMGACGGSDGPGAVAAGSAAKVQVDGLAFSVPKDWQAKQPQTAMRLAEYAIPGPGGEASLILYRFPGGGGSAQANVDRWIGQFQAPGGGSAKGTAVIQHDQRGELTLTTLDVGGAYEGQQMPGAPAQPGIPEARLLALVVEGAGDPYFLKLLGPASTVSQAQTAWNELTASVSRATP
jgi:hypothetical protein